LRQRSCERMQSSSQGTIRTPSIRINGVIVTRALWIATTTVLSLGIAREILVLLKILGAAQLPRLGLDNEQSLLAWYSSFMMLYAALLMLVIGTASVPGPASTKRHWSFLGLVFIYLSLDESISLHEKLVVPVREALHLSGVLYFSWIVVAIPVLMAMGWVFALLLLREDRRTSLRLIGAGACYVFGALGMEMIGGALVSSASPSWMYAIAIIIEESLEAVGLTLLLRALLLHLSERAKPIQFLFE
jgi:hypothetical protein